jgi:hypothetical protein
VALSSFASELVTPGGTRSVTVGDESVACSAERGMLRFSAAVRVKPGRDLVIRHRAKG